ncbi:MAG: Lrp/AsnC family transcriptional regulator [Gammaproteobacteria bacterium]|nr:Lrp/AsnC family transcriptional regulator [Gammaproteobacteria bacterium]MDH3559740.1 Lrp/AsnC family transcriptional regulator [Gammaproteobacteria bacterium]
MDATDRKILHLLQADAGLTVKQIAAQVPLSVTPCWKRIQKLEQNGIIRARVALLDPEKVNASVTVFVAIKTDQHTNEWIDHFNQAVTVLPEVMEIYRMSGEVDYLLRVVVSSIEAYDRFYKKLIGRIELSNVTSSFAMQQMKYTTALPINIEA